MLLATHTLIVPCVELTLADLDEDGGLVWDDKSVGIMKKLAEAPIKHKEKKNRVRVSVGGAVNSHASAKAVTLLTRRCTTEKNMGHGDEPDPKRV